MRFIENKFLLTSAFASALVISGCSSSSDSTDTGNGTAPQSVDLDFAAKVAGLAFTCGDTYPNVGSGNHDYKVVDYRMYINNVHVHDGAKEYPVKLDQDGVWQKDTVALLDFEDSDDSADCSGTPETNTKILGTIDGSLDLSNVEVCFEVGIPFEHNHTDVSDPNVESPFNLVDMAWSWKFGRKYLKIDGVGDPGGSPNGFNIHLGAQGCGTGPGTSAPTAQCNYPNTFEACITDFDMNADVIDVDVAGVLEGNDVTMNLGGAPVPNDPTAPKPGCMSFINDEDCVEMFPRMALDYSAYGNVTPTSSAPLQQKLFSKQ